MFEIFSESVTSSALRVSEALRVTGGKPGSVVVGPVGLVQLPICLQIRRTVFIETQGVSEGHEIDGLDPQCTHFLVWAGGVAAGTARMRVLGSAAKAERVAVLPAFAGRGLGRRLMDALETQAVACGLTRVVLNAQQQVVPFYEKLGYAGKGALFLEADIQHLAMSKSLELRLR